MCPVYFGVSKNCMREKNCLTFLYRSLDSLARFSNIRQTKALSYAAKQLISREIALEKMRRTEKGAAKGVEAANKERMTAWSIQEQAKKVRAGSDAPVSQDLTKISRNFWQIVSLEK